MKDTSATERVGRYQLLEPIGIGCCGMVARAKVFGVAGFERQFAVKKFHGDVTATAALAQALSTAARAYGSLEHPRIARMSEFGVTQGTTFTAVEFVSGLDAMRLIAEAQLSAVTLAAGGALTLISQAARAVGYAHGRGLTHLGLAPTNVIVTTDGDVKITDFGILAATLPARPAETDRLANRIAYLAPEQIMGEATSAATDVFALGVIAYELVTGQRAFRGGSPKEIASAITTGPAPEPPLPRPIVRVLQRCLARSPFERFPDARALADALDAALRVAPVPGTRKDIGAQVKETIDRIAAMNEGGLSGVLAINVGTGPIRRIDQPEVPTLGRDSNDSIDMPTQEFLPDGEPEPEPEPAPISLSGLSPANTMPDMLRTPLVTMPGLAPPPIPVPQGIAAGTPPPPIPTNPPLTPPMTLLGIPPSPRLSPKGLGSIPSIKPVVQIPIAPVVPAVIPVVPTPVVGRLATRELERLPRPLSSPLYSPDGLIEAEPLERLEPMDGRAFEMEADFGSGPAGTRRKSPTDEIAEALGGNLGDTWARPTAEAQPLVANLVAAELAVQAGLAGTADPELDLPLPAYPTPVPMPGNVPHQIGQPLPEAPAVVSSSGSIPMTMPGIMPPPRPSAPLMLSYPTVEKHETEDHENATAVPKKKSSLPWIIGGLLGLGVLGFVGWMVWDVMSDDGVPVAAKKPGPKDAGVAGSPDAVVIAMAQLDATAAALDAGKPNRTDAPAVAMELDAAKVPDAAILAMADAAGPVDAAAIAATPKDAPVVVATGSNDTLLIDSTPHGAHVYLDGSDQGVTPAKLAGTTDRHNLALLLAGHDLYTAQIDGHGNLTIPLKEVTPMGGPAGIKVLTCKVKDRYYVFVDGKPTGQTCPTERIETDVGPHVVEIYDAMNDARKKFDIVVKDTRLSYRVKIE